MLPCRMAVEGIARRVEGHVIRQAYRERFARHRHHAARCAVHHRNRAAPVALPRDAPIAEPVADGRTAGAAFRKLCDGARLGVGHREPVQEVGIDGRAVADIGLVADLDRIRILPRRTHHWDNWQVLGAGEIQIALIVSRTAEDRAGAVVHEHEIGDVERQRALGVEGVADAHARVEAALARRLDVALADAGAVALGNEVGERRVGSAKRCRQRVVG